VKSHFQREKKKESTLQMKAVYFMREVRWVAAEMFLLCRELVAAF
jgi:hypothetical protein